MLQKAICTAVLSLALTAAVPPSFASAAGSCSQQYASCLDLCMNANAPPNCNQSCDRKQRICFVQTSVQTTVNPTNNGTVAKGSKSGKSSAGSSISGLSTGGLSGPTSSCTGTPAKCNMGTLQKTH